jgi:hypothetical protein
MNSLMGVICAQSLNPGGGLVSIVNLLGGDYTNGTGNSDAGLAAPAEIVSEPPIRKGERPPEPSLPENY